MICTLCNFPIEEGESYGTMIDSGPFGMSEGEEIGKVHTECWEEVMEDDEEDE